MREFNLRDQVEFHSQSSNAIYDGEVVAVMRDVPREFGPGTETQVRVRFRDGTMKTIQVWNARLKRKGKTGWNG